MPWAKLPKLAKHLDLSPRTVRQLIKDGVIPVVKLPSGTIIGNLNDIDEALRSLAHQTDSKTEQILKEILR